MRRTCHLAAGLALLAAASLAEPPSAPRPLRGFRAEVAALLMQGVRGGGLPIAAAVFPAPRSSSGGGHELGFVVEVAAPEPGGSPPALEVYVYAVDAAGEVAAHRAVELPPQLAGGEGIKLAGRLELPRGDYSLRFLVFDAAASRYGLEVRPVRLGEAAAAPRLAEECEGWARVGDGGGLGEISARPVLVAGERRRLSLGPEPPAPPDGWRVRLERVGPREPAMREVAATPGRQGGLELGLLEFEVPRLPDGVYGLSVVGAGLASPALDAWLVSALPPAEGGCARSWPRILQLARSARPRPAPPPAAAPAAGERPAGRAMRRLGRAYRGVVEALAESGDMASAAGRLAELEAPLIERDASRLRPLLTAELGVVRALAESDARCLIPLVVLHAEAYVVHHAAGRFPLSTHSRRVAAEIAELAAELLAEPEERALSAAALTGLAGMGEKRRASSAAQRLLERALELDPDQEAARLLLAVSYERKGLYDAAREQLERLVSANAAHYEARVRLAILLRRMGEDGRAEGLLRRVIAERPPAWLLTLSYQTLGQLFIGEGRYDEAKTLLEDGRRRLRGDQAMQLMLAYALDRQGQRHEAERLLAGLPAAAAGNSARYRYSDQPAAALGLLRDTLRRSVVTRLPVLALSLRQAAAGGPAP